jgi:hypothetical protein
MLYCHYDYKWHFLGGKFQNLKLFCHFLLHRLSMYSSGIKTSGTIFLSLQKNLCKAPSTVIMTDIQKLNFSVSVTQSILNFEISVSCNECN